MSFFKTFVSFQVKITPSKWSHIQNLIQILIVTIFHVGFKNLIGFTAAILKSAKPAPYLDGTKMTFFKGMEVI